MRSARRVFDVFGSVPARSALIVSIASCIWFAVRSPHVGDLWAAIAREQSVRAGVGLSYWFSWYSGGASPGSYSLLTPWLSATVGVELLVVLGTVLLLIAVAYAVRGTANPGLAIWICALVSSANLWSGRVAYTMGAVMAVTAVIAIRSRRPAAAAALGVVSVLFSPVAGAFLAMGAAGAALASLQHRRANLLCFGATALALLATTLRFGTPGPQGFTGAGLVLGIVMLVAMLLARPNRTVTVVLALTLLAVPVLALVPNGMAANVLRLNYTALPVAVAATTRLRSRVRLAVCLLPALLYCAAATIGDLRVAAAPVSQPQAYAGLRTELTHLTDLDNHRLEVTQDGSHASAAMLLDTVALARGYETQAENALDPVLNSPALSAPSYRTWLDENAVGYVAAAREPVVKTLEWQLVTSRTPDYLAPVWSDGTYVLYQVQDAATIVPAPVTLVAADQASMTVSVPHPLTITLRLRWSNLLAASSKADGTPVDLDRTPDGWTRLTVPAAGQYSLYGK